MCGRWMVGYGPFIDVFQHSTARAAELGCMHDPYRPALCLLLSYMHSMHVYQCFVYARVLALPVHAQSCSCSHWQAPVMMRSHARETMVATTCPSGDQVVACLHVKCRYVLTVVGVLSAFSLWSQGKGMGAHVALSSLTSWPQLS
jgi:hypothetical protein